MVPLLLIINDFMYVLSIMLIIFFSINIFIDLLSAQPMMVGLWIILPAIGVMVEQL